MNWNNSSRAILHALFVSALTFDATLTPFAAYGLPITQIVIEPDDYLEDQILNTVSPHVTLSAAAFSDNRPTFDVTARTDASDTSTGTKVFTHSGVSFWNDSRKLRMDFHSQVNSVSVDYIASGFSSESYVGRLEAYSAGGILIDTYETSPLAESQFETMTVTAPQIAYALAYPPEDPFGDLDNLRFNIPEPTTLAIAIFGIAICGMKIRRRRS
jgi:hypothetical protein